MLNKNQFYCPVLWKLIWGNRIFRARIIGATISFPALFFTMTLTANYFHLPIPISYVLMFLSGLYFHLYITIFTISMVYSYVKFLFVYRLLLKLILLIYLLGFLTSLINSVIMLGLISFNFMNVGVGQVYIAFILINFVLTPICIWIASYDYFRADLFGSNASYYQPKSLHLVLMLCVLAAFNLVIGAHKEFSWSLNVEFSVLVILIFIIGFLLKPITKSIYVNCQNMIAE